MTLAHVEAHDPRADATDGAGDTTRPGRPGRARTRATEPAAKAPPASWPGRPAARGGRWCPPRSFPPRPERRPPWTPNRRLKDAEAALAAGDLAEAAESLRHYQEWRAGQGFEPPGGDAGRSGSRARLAESHPVDPAGAPGDPEDRDAGSSLPSTG